MKAAKVIKVTSTEIQTAFKEYAAASDSLRNVLIRADQTGWSRKDLVAEGVKAGLAEQSARNLVSGILLASGKRARRSVQKVSPELKEFMKYVLAKYDKEDAASLCLAASRQFKKS